MPWYKDKILWFIAAGALFIKLAGLLWLLYVNPLGEQALIFPDSLGYVYPAQTLLTYGRLWEAVSASPMLLRTPGYPVFLAWIQFCTANSTWAVVIWQNLLSVVLLLPVYLTARRLGGILAARWAAGLCAASVLYYSLAFAILTETLCVFFLAWFVYAAVRWLETLSGRDLAAAGVLLALAVYVRPAAYYFTALAVAGSISWAWIKKSSLILRQSILCFTLPLLLLIGAWQVRNYVQTGYGGFTTVGAYNLYIWNEDYVARQAGLSVDQAHQQLQAQLPENWHELSAAQQVRAYKRLALPLIQQGWKYKLQRGPLWAAKTLLGNNYTHLSQLLFGRAPSPEDVLNHTGLWRTDLNHWLGKIIFIITGSAVLCIVLLSIWGGKILLQTHPAAACFLIVYCGYFWAIGSVFFGAYARFRAPFEFVLCILAALAVTKKHAAPNRRTACN